MQTVLFGRGAFEVSRFGMGCMRLPTIKAADGSDAVDEAEAIRMIRHAVDGGVNYFDTAYMYHGGQSELVVGRALRDGYRERVRLVTKLPGSKFTTPEACLDEQLAKLQTDHLDLYLLHGLNVKSWAVARERDLFAFLDKAKASGKIKLAGFSFHDGTRLFKQIIDAYPWDACQIQFNFLDENYQAGLEGLRYAASRGVSIVVMEPLRGGLLGQNVPEDVMAVWRSSPVHRTPAEWALRWLAEKPEVTVVLSGVSAMDQLQENMRLFRDPVAQWLEPRDRDLFVRAKEIYQAKTKIGCTACGYCMPCPSGVSIPNVFRSYNAWALGGNLAGGRNAYKRMLVNNKSDASHCTECGQCEAACPQDLPIIRTLKEAHQVLAG
jgi:uncharacterized protein